MATTRDTGVFEGTTVGALIGMLSAEQAKIACLRR